MRHKKPLARHRDLLSFELVSDVFFKNCKLPQTHAIFAETRQTYLAVLSEPKVEFLRIPIWPNLQTPLKTPKCWILSQRIGLNLKNFSEKKAGPQKRKNEDKTKRVSMPLFDVYFIYWKKILFDLLGYISLATKWPTIPAMIIHLKLAPALNPPLIVENLAFYVSGKFCSHLFTFTIPFVMQLFALVSFSDRNEINIYQWMIYSSGFGTTL